MSTTPRARHDRLIVEELGDELLVYDSARMRAHSLNATAAAVFRHADGEHTTEQLAALTGVDEQSVLLALAELQRCHLLEEAPDPSVISRRTALRRAALAGGAIGAGLPIIRSITAPSIAQAAASTPCSDGECATDTDCCDGRRCTNGGSCADTCKSGNDICDGSGATSCCAGLTCAQIGSTGSFYCIAEE